MLFLNEVKIFAKTVADLGSTGLEVLVTVSLFAVAYSVGYIMFRIGATGIEPLLKKVFGWVEYKDFIAAGKTNKNAFEKLELLSREYSYARTHITLSAAITVLAGIREVWWLMVSCILCLVLFVLTARRHMKKIKTAVLEYLESCSRENRIAE